MNTMSLRLTRSRLAAPRLTVSRGRKDIHNNSARIYFRFASSSQSDRRNVSTKAVPPVVVLEEEKTPTDANPSTTTGGSSSSSTKAYLDLAKARLSTLVVATTAAGFVAAGAPIATHWDVFLASTIGTALCASSAAAWNQVFEIDRDSRMKRTQQRPLVTGELTPRQGAVAATAWGVTGTSLLVAFTDPVTAALGAGNIALYAGLYTYMKPRSIYNTWVGAVVGAIPPVMGWTAATGGSLFDIEPLLLGSTLFIWQMPHFFALSYMHRIDYKRGGFQMVPCLEEDGEKTAGLVTRYTWYLSTIPFIATLTDVTSSMFALEGIALNSYALYVAYKFSGNRTNANARKVFLTSLWYLPTFMVLFLLHSKVWDEEKEEDDFVSKYLADSIHWARSRGRELCVHETAAAKAPSAKDNCPLTMGSRATRESVDSAAAAVASTSAEVSIALQEQNTEK